MQEKLEKLSMFHLSSWRGIKKYLNIRFCHVTGHIYLETLMKLFFYSCYVCLTQKKKVWLATALCTFAIVRWLEIFRQRQTYRFSKMRSEYHRRRWTENNSNLKTLFLMFCEPEGQELNTFICSIFLWIFWHPWDPWGCVYIDLKKKMVSDLAVCRSNLTHLRKDTQ